MSRLYWYAESLDLTAAQRQTLWQQLRALQLDANSPQPCNRNHSRVRLDGLACIWEADLDTTYMTPASIKSRLATIFGVAANTITFSTVATAYGDAITFKYNSTNKLRLGVFGGLEADPGTSNLAAQSYIKANLAQWEVPNG